MAGIDLHKSCLNALSQVSDDVKDALVYLDAGAGEALHFIGGLAALLPFNPRAVCSLENASPLDAAAHWNTTCKEPVQKLLVVTARLLSDAHRHILRCLRLHSSLNLCTILTSISEEAHSAHPDTPLGPDAFHVYKRLLSEDFQAFMQKAKLEHTTEGESHMSLWNSDDAKEDGHGLNLDLNVEGEEVDYKSSAECSKKGNVGEKEETIDDISVGLTIKVKHFPMIFCPLTSNAFVFPSGGALAEAPLSDKLDKGLGLGLPGIDAGVVTRDDDNIPIGGTLLAHFLQHLAVQLELKMDIFTLGPLSREVGKLVTEFSGLTDVSGRTKRSAGLLLIDRTLDLITPSCHGDSLMDRFFTSLPRRNSENGFQRLTSGTKFVSIRRRPLDIRVPVTGFLKTMGDDNTLGWIEQKLSILANASNECDLQIGTPENQKKFMKRKNDTDYTPLDKTLTKLCTMGGSLFDAKESRETGHIDLLFEKRTKEILLTVKKWLQEALRREKLNPHKRGRLGAVTAEEICLLRKQLSQKSGSSVRHADLIQIATSVEYVLGSTFGPKWEALSSAEKVLMLSVGDSRSVAFQIRDLVHQSIQAEKSRRSLSDQPQGFGLISLRDALTLAVVGYALAGDSFGSSVSGGPFSWEEEKELKDTVVDAILQGFCEENVGFLHGLEDSLVAHCQGQDSGVSVEGANLGSLPHEVDAENSQQDAGVNPEEGWETWEDDLDQDLIETDKNSAGGQSYGEMQLQLELRDRVEEVFKRLHRVSEARRYLTIKDKPLPLEEKSAFGGSSCTQRSLLYRILALVFTRTEIPGMEHHSSAVGRFFIKSGLGRFGLGQAKPKLSDFKTILVFMIGGINGVEVCEVKEAQAAYPVADGVDVLLGGTTFLAPDDIYNLLLGSSTSL